MKLRSVGEAYKELKAADPKCSLGRAALYKLVADEIIPSVRVGKKYLIDLDYLESYLSGKISSEAAR